MQYTKEFSEGFTPWSGAVSTYERIEREAGLDALERALEEVFGEKTPTDTEINDILWFEPETLYKALGMKPDDTHVHELGEIAAAWVGENPDYVNVRAEIIDGETVRVFFVDPEDEDREEQTEDLDAEDVARLLGSDNCGEIDEDAGTVETWRE